MELEIDNKRKEQHEVFHVIIDEAADDVQDNNLNHMQARELEVAEIVMPAQQENKSERSVTRKAHRIKQRSRCGRPPGFITMINFREGVVSHLDCASRDARMENKEFDKPAVFARDKLSVTMRVLQWLQEHGVKDSVPTIQFIDNIVDILGQKYPAVF
jgi:hypothetical protein